eukprot:CAMPEP_0115657718 /NCGR_PEP_ID=MMETSP0272-20121206/44833_1 /TAXON_ID=71861 /ORGANISM="Scrippsiella trochoidea, Strain CCMP3099" /LENGTH=76 /DNA_ID=CAMNT_0003095771 /DNA_START=73 /DNA_END=299 /DNA_ORIENTATION=-
MTRGALTVGFSLLAAYNAACLLSRAFVSPAGSGVPQQVDSALAQTSVAPAPLLRGQQATARGDSASSGSAWLVAAA